MLDYINKGFKCVSVRLLACLLFSFAFQSQAHQAALLPSGIKASVSINKQSLSVDDQIWAVVRYTNVSNVEVALLKRATALGGGMTEDLFSITYKGLELNYTGIHVKWAPPIASDYIYLAPGQSASEKIDLLRSYPINYKGEYEVSLRDPGASAGSDVQAKTNSNLSINLDKDRLVRVFKRVPRFQNCSSGQRSEIDAALTSAERIANESSRTLQSIPVALRPNSQRYTEWFGAYSAARYAEVARGMSRIASATSNQTIGFNCDCSNQPGVDPNQTFAFVFPSDAFNMTLCNVFFRVPREGTDSKSGTIVHEISHFNIVAATDDFSSALDQRGSRNLARSSPSSAIRNANAFEYFAENTPMLSVLRASDLSLSEFRVEKEPLIVSRQSTIFGRVKNQSNSVFPVATFSLRLSGQAGGSPVAQVDVSALRPNTSQTIELSFSAPNVRGEVSYEVCLSSIAGEEVSNGNCATLSNIEVSSGFVIAPIIPLLLDD